MKEDELLDAIGEISERHVSTGDELSPKKKSRKASRRFWTWFTAAVLIAAIALGTFTATRPQADPPDISPDISPDASPALPNDTSIPDASSSTPPDSSVESPPEDVILPNLPSRLALVEVQYPEMIQWPGDTGVITDEWRAWHAQFDERYYWWLNGNISKGLLAFTDVSTRTILGAAGTENAVFSPFTLIMALGMLTEVTEGETRQELLDLLGGSDADSLRQELNTIWNYVYTDDSRKLSIPASSLWLRDDIPYALEPLEAIAENYYASSYSGRMGSVEMNAALREWLNSRTGGQLTDGVSGVSLKPETVLAIATTLQYNAKWLDVFDPKLTDEGIFHAPGGDVTVEFMHLKIGMGSVDKGEDYSALYLSFTDYDGHMFFILPDEGVEVSDILQKYDLTSLLAGDYDSIWLNLDLPKFDVSSQLDLIEPLRSLGLELVFDPDSADFSPLTELETGGIYLAEALQGVRVAIDEEGMEASSFTWINDYSTGYPHVEANLTFDRPFIFMIAEGTLPLFVGVVNEP